MHRPIRVLAIAAIVSASLLLSASTVLAAGPTRSAWTRVVGHVYVDANSAGRNAIAGFDRHADGSLTPIPGSPFDAGGVGTGTPTGSAGAIQRTDDGRYLVAVDAGSDQLSVLRIRRDGSLRLVDLVASNGHKPVSVTIHHDLVYVANAGAGGSDYTGFRLDAGGRLHPIPRSTVPLPDDAMPGQVLFSADGRTLVGMRVGPSAGPSFIDSFRVGSLGRLTPAAGSPYPAQRIGPFGSAFSPAHPDELFVSNAHDGPGAGSVSVYHVGRHSRLTAIPGSPFADGQTAPCWVAISPDGRHLFAINTAVPSITSYGIGHGGRLTLLGSTPFADPTGLAPFDAALDPLGRFLYVVDAGTAQVSAFAVDGGGLSELPGSPSSIPSGGAPFGIVVD